MNKDFICGLCEKPWFDHEADNRTLFTVGNVICWEEDEERDKYIPYNSPKNNNERTWI